jgi:subtilisin family serine protease
VDDDGNGFVDDFRGWDFGNNDNDPIYGTDEARVTVHGTHTAGIAGAMTNNVTGIAGVGWNCRIMPIKASRDDDALSIPFGYEGIVYAADNGAQIINNSWGRSGLYSQFEQDIINYAVSKGSIVVAAAGNTRKNETFFPAAYVHVIAVAAVNELDAKASYSTFGKFVDLSAPGGDGNMGILSTFPVARGSYGAMNGTSFASPIVAGILGLLINRFPHFDQAELIRQIVLTSDNIDHINPNFVGLLGNGRANAFRAITLDREMLREQPAKVEFFKAAIYDSVWGNGNFLLERNEVIGVDVWYRNYAVSPGQNLTVTLATDDPDIAIPNGQAVVGFVPSDAIFKIEKQLSFKISLLAKPHVAK